MVTRRLTQAAFVLLTLTVLAPLASAQNPEAPPKDPFGDALPARALARMGTVRWRHGDAVTFATYTPDGKGVVTDSQDGTIRLWDLKTGAELRRFVKPDRKQLNFGDLAFLVILRTMGYGTALSPDGKLLAAGSVDGSITVWDFQTGKVRHTLRPPVEGDTLLDWATRQAPAGLVASTPILSLLFNSDSSLLISKDNDQILRVWDAAEGKLLHKLGKPPEQRVRQFPAGALSGSPTLLAGDVLASFSVELARGQGGVSRVLRRYDLVTGRELPPVRTAEGGDDFLAFTVAPDGKAFATAGFQGGVRLWDGTTGKELHQLEGLKGKSFATQFAISPDSKVLAGWGSDQTIHLWDVASGKALRTIGEPRGPQFMGIQFFGGITPSNLSFSADSKELLVGTSGGTVLRWEVETGKEVGPANGHQAAVLTLALSPDGKTLLTRGTDRKVYLWDRATGKEVRSLALPGDAMRAAFAPDGETLALATTEGTLKLWDLKAGKELRQWKAHQSGLADLTFTRDGKTLATRGHDKVIHLWDPRTGKELRQIGESAQVNDDAAGLGILQSLFGGWVANLAFSGDGTTLAAMPPVFDPLSAAVFGERGMQGKPGPIRLWDAATGKELRPFDEMKKVASSFAFSPDGRAIATATSDGSVLVWETLSGKVRAQFTPRQTGTITVLAFSPDSQLLVGALPDHTIRVWEPLTGKEIGKLSGHQGQVHTLAFAPDGKELFSGSADTTVLTWDLRPILKAQPNVVVALEDGKAEEIWASLADADAAKATAAALKLLAAPEQALPLLRERLKPVTPPDAAKVAQFLTDLDSKDFNVRQTADAELEKLGELAEQAVKEALAAGPTLERRQRLERLRERLVKTGEVPPELRQALRGVEVLERLGTPEAREVLTALAKGAVGARVTKQAQAALDRVGTRLQ